MDKIIEKVKELRNAGLSYGKIAKELMISKSQAVYFSKVDLEDKNRKIADREKYEKDVCDIAKKSRNFNQLCKVLDKHNIDYSHFISEPEKYNGFQKKRDINEILVSGITVSITHLKERLLKEGLKEHKCERCGRAEWEKEPIPLQLHHINGDRTDNRLENLQVLCPNCHALTDNYCLKKNKKESNKCVICGKEISRNSKYCEECYHNTENGKRFKKSKEFQVPKEILIESFKKYGNFRQVSKEFKVSDKTIAKWFSKIGLPNKSKELREYFISKYGNLKWKFLSGNAKEFRKYQNEHFKKVCLLSDDGKVEKIYKKPIDIINDGFNPQNVYRVCKGTLKTHHKRLFKYYE